MIRTYSLQSPGRAPQLDSDAFAVWERLFERSEPAPSPFLHPTFARAVARACGDVEVALAFDGDDAVLALPFQRHRSRAMPLGGRIADVQGPLVRPGARVDPGELMRAARIRAWQFDRADAAALGSLASGDGAGWVRRSAAWVDLSEGFESYRIGRKAAGSRAVDQALRKSRKIERELGPLRLEWDDPDPAVLAQLFDWKADQRARTRTVDVFQEPWARDTVQALLEARGAPVGARVASLHAGDRLVAAHLGLTGERALAWWVPAYAPQVGSYSPGLVLLTLLAREAAERGVQRIELGPGDERYKASLANGQSIVVEGELGGAALGRRLWRAARGRIRDSALEPAFLEAKSLLRRAVRRGSGRARRGSNE